MQGHPARTADRGARLGHAGILATAAIATGVVERELRNRHRVRRRRERRRPLKLGAGAGGSGCGPDRSELVEDKASPMSEESGMTSIRTEELN